MSIENHGDDQSEQRQAIEVGKKIHQTHFSVQETRFKNDGQDNDYEWVNSGPGRLKRVLKKLSTVLIRKK